MQDHDPNPPKETQPLPPQPQESPLESAGEVVVQHHTTPPRTRAPQKIHSRRPLPLVPLSRSQRKKPDFKDSSK